MAIWEGNKNPYKLLHSWLAGGWLVAHLCLGRSRDPNQHGCVRIHTTSALCVQVPDYTKANLNFALGEYR